MKIHATPKSKKLLLVRGAIFTVAVIVATTVFSTVAYLTATASVTNTFTVGKVMLTLTEAAVDTNGKKVTTGERVHSNNYHLVPNKTYDKDPVITIDASSELSYMFIVVRNDLEDIECKHSEHVGTEAGQHNAPIADQLAANGWKYVETRSTGKVYVYVGVDENGNPGDTPLPVKGNQDDLNANRYVLFRTFSIDEHANITDAYAKARVTINALAIQADTLVNANAAWAALIEAYPEVAGTLENTNTTEGGTTDGGATDGN